jgi:hypothetical protein
MCKKAIVVYFNVLSQYLHGGIADNDENIEDSPCPD